MKEEDNIEKFFRKHLTEKEFEFDETQWAQLEKKLDDLYPAPVVVPPPPGTGSTGSSIKWIALILLTALISFWSGWYLKTNTDERLPSDEQTNKSVKPAEDSKSQSGEGKDSKSPKNNNTKANSTKDHEAATSISGTTESASGNSDSYRQEVPSRYKAANEGALSNDSDVRRSNNAAVISGDHRTSAFARTGFDDESARIYRDSLDARVKGEVVKVPLLPLAGMNPLTADTIQSSEVYHHRNSRVDYFGFVAPDFNGTKNSNLLEGAGTAGGVGASYYIMENIRIGLGLTLDNKIYSAARGEYRPGRGFWTNRIAPVETEAKCLALDIPINAAYRVIHFSRTSFWINAGISSYWLLTEKYKYIYANPDTALIQQWSCKRKYSDLLSSVNLSVIYELQLKNKLTFFIEPYYKIPVGEGIGHGSVELLSGGINFGLRLRPVSKEKNQLK